ncbi:MAG: DinB family protein [Chloroflexi bacterium]|nr:DinB family protein [Chloroflexota bacterium]
MNPSSLLTTYQRSGKVMLLNLEGVSHQQSLWSPAANVNCVNWLAGHLISARTNITLAVGGTPVWDDATRARYKGGSPAITADGEGVLSIERLIADFTESQQRIEAGLNDVTSDTLDSPSKFPQFASVADQLIYLHVHEMHHIGQIMILRELLGLTSHWA